MLSPHADAEHEDDLLTEDYSLRLSEGLRSHFAVEAVCGEKLDQTFRALENSEDLPTEAGSVYLAFDVAMLDLLSSEGKDLHTTGALDNNRLAREAANRLLDIRYHQHTASTTDQNLRAAELGGMAFALGREAQYRENYHAVLKLDQQNPLAQASEPAEWRDVVVNTLSACWQVLFRGPESGGHPEDKHQILEAVALLKAKQPNKETELFAETDTEHSKPVALDLVCLYHLARATEMVTQNVIAATTSSEQQHDDVVITDRFRKAEKAAVIARTMNMASVVAWLSAGSRNLQKSYQRPERYPTDV